MPSATVCRRACPATERNLPCCADRIVKTSSHQANRSGVPSRNPSIGHLRADASSVAKNLARVKALFLPRARVECIGKGKASAPYDSMAWNTPALSGNLEPPKHQEHKPCPICTLRLSVSISGRVPFMLLVLMLPVPSHYAKSVPEHAFAKGATLQHDWSVPKHISTGDRTILGGVSRRSNRYLQTLFIRGARSVLLRRQSWPKHGFGAG